MRIIAGLAKGHLIKVPRDVARPTTDRVRESLFGLLSAVLPGAGVLDLYAGSGGLGLEALSRGAKSCTFVDQHRGAIRTIQENLAKTGLANGRVVTGEVEIFLKREQNCYDLIFADPPYPDGINDLAGDLVAMEGWERWLSEDGFLIIERESAGEVPPAPGLKIVKQRDYGRSRILIYQRAF